MECLSKIGSACEARLLEKYPLCKEHNPELFYDVCQHYLIMIDVANKVSVPIEELMEFFYKGKLKTDLLMEQEEVLKKNE